MMLGFTVSCIEKFWCAPILRQHNSFETTRLNNAISSSGVPRVVWGVQIPPPQIPKAFQNSAKLNPIVKTVKNC